MPDERPIVIAGAGIGGLTAAIALAQRGLSALVLERGDAIRAVGAGIALQLNAMQVMRSLGLHERLLAEGEPLLEGLLRDRSGQVLQRVSMRETNASLGVSGIAIARRRLLAVLAEANPAPVRCSAGVVGFEQTDDGVRVRCEDGSVVEGRAVVGCDGLHSAVRKLLRGEDPLHYAGYTTWRAIARGVALQTLGTEEIWGAGERFGVVPIGHGEVYWFAVAEAPPGGRDGDDAIAELKARFAGWPTVVQELLRHTEAADIIRTDTFDRDPIDAWSEGRVALLGDAAHPMTPNLGQGAGQAIEDALALAQALHEHPDDVSAGLRTYVERRCDRANKLVRQSRRMGALAQWKHPWARGLRNALMRLTPAWLVERSTKALYDLSSLTGAAQ